VETAPHTFVVQTDLTTLDCDLVLVPTDVNLSVEGNFRDYFGEPPRPLPLGWGNSGVRVTDAMAEPSGLGRQVRWVNTGAPLGADIDWLFEGVRQGLEAAQATPLGNSAAKRRHRRLIGLPPFGVGAGGFGDDRGEVLDGILAHCHSAVTDYKYDIAIACLLRSDYAALQHRRRTGGNAASPALPDTLQLEAQSLGERARAGDLALFLGSGVSKPAGLPTWKELIQQLAKFSPTYRDRISELEAIPETDAATILKKDLGSQPFREALRAALTTVKLHSLSHGLLASLRTREAITTNFDALYEQACDVTFRGRTQRKLPWQRAEPGIPWLLKLHGDVNSEELVLSREEYLGFDTQWRPLASMVQAIMMTRHVLFAGFSLRDENFIRLAREVGLLLERMSLDRKVGTVLTLQKNPMLEALWGADLKIVTMAPRETDETTASSILNIFLDCLAMHAASGESSYLLDARYEALVDNADAAVVKKLTELGQAIDLEDHTRWSDVAAFLENYGYRKRTT
jgi:hypothetical protein